MRLLPDSPSKKMNRFLLTLLALGFTLCGCRPPGASQNPTPPPRVVLSWRAPSTGLAGALLHPALGPATRLVRSPESTHLEPIDRVLAHLDPLRPVELPEISQPRVVRLSVSADLAGLGTHSNLLCAIEAELEGGREHLRALLTRDGVPIMVETPGLSLALDHRAELFYQLGAAFREVATVPQNAVLTNAQTLASTHARIAAGCDRLARELDQADGHSGRSGSQRWLAPGADSRVVVLRAFAGEWRQRACSLASLRPTEEANPLRIVPTLRDWWRSREVLSNQFPQMRESIRSTLLAWERHRPGAAQSSPLTKALATSCDGDRVDLIHLSRFCSQQATVPDQPPTLSEVFVEMGSQALSAALELERIAGELSGTPPPTRKTSGS